MVRCGTPRATICREAERIAERDRNARVIYGDDIYNDRYGDRYGTGRVYEDGRDVGAMPACA